MEGPLEAAKLLERFVHLGNLLPFYVRKREYIAPVMVAQLVPYLAKIDGDTFLKLADKWLLHQGFARQDEIWFAVASYLIASEVEIAEKLKVRDQFPVLAKEPEDLFLFARYSMSIIRDSGRKGLSKTIRKAIVLWYKSKTTSEMLECLARNRGLHGFTHRDLIAICHINLSETNLKDIHQTIFKRANRLLKIVDEQEGELDQPLKRMKAIAELKTCQEPETAVKLIKEHKFSFEHLPIHLYRYSDVWKEVLPRMSVQQMIRVCALFSEKKMFQNKHFATAFLQILMKHQNATPKTCEIHPYVFLVEKSKQAKLARYSEKVKACYYTKKVKRHGLKPCPGIVDKLNECFLKSFHNVQGTGLTTFITINLQKSYSTRPVISQKQVTCQEAAITFALAYFKSEKNSVVCTYTETNGELAEISWKRNMGYKSAEEACETLINKKNCQRSYFPLIEARKKKQAFDLFVIIVPSISRGNPGNKPSKALEVLKQYREKKNEKAKMVIINLCRFKPALQHDLKQEDGILEICGVDENTPKLIKAFALGVFT